MGKEKLDFKQDGHQAFTISFSLSDVCLEGQFYDQISNIVTHSGDSIVEVKNWIVGGEEHVDSQ